MGSTNETPLEILKSRGLGGGRQGVIALAVFMTLYALAFLDRQVLTLLVDPIRKDIGATDFQISLLQGAAFVIFFTICGMPIGWAVDRFPRRWIIFWGLTFWSLSAAAGGLARTYWHLLLARCGVGAGEASLAPSVYSILSDLFPRERLAGAMAIFSTGAVIGGAISLAVGGVVVGLASKAQIYHLPLVGEVKPWQLVFIVTGLPGLLLTSLVFLVREPPRSGKLGTGAGAVEWSALFAFMKERRGFYASHFIGFSLFNLMSAGYIAWMPTYLIRSFHWPVSKVGLVMGGIALVFGAAGMLGSGYFVDHLFRRGMRDAHLRYYVLGTLACGAAGLGASLSRNLALVVPCMAVIAFVVPFIAVAAAALQITTPNQFRGRTSAMFLFIYNVVGFGCGPAIIAGVSDWVFGGKDSLGAGMAVCFAFAAPLSALTFALGLRSMREAVESASAWAAPSPAEILD